MQTFSKASAFPEAQLMQKALAEWRHPPEVKARGGDGLGSEEEEGDRIQTCTMPETLHGPFYCLYFCGTDFSFPFLVPFLIIFLIYRFCSPL